MVDNRNIYVDTDYNNVIVLDPNRVVGADNVVKERLLQHEELAMYVSLTCDVVPRTKLLVGKGYGDLEIGQLELARINFMKPGNKPFLDNSYTDFEAKNTIDNSTNSQINKLFELSDIVNNKKLVGTETNDQGLLGITNIDIDLGFGNVPVVKVQLEDIRGRALFELGDKSPYAAFFNMPYPVFTLTFKGYIGKANKYELMLESFNARFNSQTGNFIIDLVFKGYKFSILEEIQPQILFAVPYMYRTTYNVTNNANQPNNVQSSLSQTSTNQNTLPTQVVVTSKGKQKIIEMYNEYKSKGLIAEDFPPLTIQEFFQKAEIFEKQIEDGFIKVEMSALSDIDDYRRSLVELQQKVLYLPQDQSWAKKWLDQDLYFILKDDKKVYFLKKGRNKPEDFSKSTSEIKKIFFEYSEILNNNKTCGTSGTYTIGDKTESIPIQIKLEFEKLRFDLKKEDIDFEKTYKQQTGQNPQDNLQKFEDFTKNLSESIFNVSLVEKNGEVQKESYYYCFEQKGGFDEEIKKVSKKLEQNRQLVENAISEALAQKLQDKNTNGFGFSPTLRNVFAVVMASVEAYFRLLDDVHLSAWDQRNAIERKRSITTESPDYLANKFDDDFPVFPWPMYVVETDDEKSKYEKRYPGETNLVNFTQAFRFDIWPEVEFVEEFIKGLAEKKPLQPDQQTPTNEILQPQRISLNVIDYPISNQVYFNKQIVKFFFEIWERTYIAAYYQRLNRGNTNLEELFDVIAETEVENIVTSLGSDNPSIIQKLKNYKFDSQNILDVLRHFSNEGTGESWQQYIRAIFVTPYLVNDVDNPFVLYTNNQIFEEKTIPNKSVQNIDKVKLFLESTETNEIQFTDTLPFTYEPWLKNNVQNGIGTDKVIFNNTNKVIQFNEDKKILANFSDENDVTSKRPITNYNYITLDSNINPDLKTFYTDSKIKYQYPTEGTIVYDGYDNELIARQSTSILNTPYFVNSIINGVTNFQTNQQYPFTSGAYLFLNSLPLITLREKYSSFSSGVKTNLDYISATLKKFGAVHKVPYAWVLKYGSIWWRYKSWIGSGKSVDPISNEWASFNQKFYYDPVTSQDNKIYTINIDYPDGTSVPNTIVLQFDTIQSTLQRHTTICSGFYPGAINEFNLFLQGTYLINFNYTNNDIQFALDNLGLKVIPGTPQTNLYYGTSSNFDINFSSTTYTARTLSYKTYTTYVTAATEQNYVYLLPSFGSLINQCQQECFYKNNNYSEMKTELYNNQSLFDGSVRTFWNAPHFGYFDNSKVSIPKPNEYLKQVYYNQEEQENFSIVNSNYTDISELFSVFTKEDLDVFESEFLKFSKSVYDFVSPEEMTEDEKSYHNFQLLIRNLMKVESPTSVNFPNIIQELQTKQLTNLGNVIKGFLEYDYMFKVSNPTNFDRRIFTTLANRPITDRYVYSSYNSASPNALPTTFGTTTLSQSTTSYPLAWNALELYVGFSNISQLQYKNSGSYITDFFVDLGVEFNEVNVINFTPLIKLYSTWRLNNPIAPPSNFINRLNDFFDDNDEFQSNIINSVFIKLSTRLPDVTAQQDKSINSVLDGNINKIDLYYTFKAFNDKWIAGKDVQGRTYFEDILFLDYANRNIGDIVLVDVFKMVKDRQRVEGLKTIMSLFMSICGDLNLVPQKTPGFVNFYGTLTPSKDLTTITKDTTEIANNLFGTFLEVDTEQAGSKLIFYAPSTASNNLKMPNNQNYMFNDDGFVLSRPTNPTVESPENKDDWALSNKNVGFDVNLSTQSQNIFYNLSLGMDSGKATAPSIQNIVNLAENNAKKTASQNFSLLNFYKNQSYTCSLSMLGNALIQPNMWFNLNHVPMFAGTYRITEVHHSITPGKFETVVSGQRQAIQTFPLNFEYLQSLNKRVYTSLKSKVDSLGSNKTTQPTNVLDQKNDKVNNAKESKTPASNTEGCTAFTKYETYSVTDPTQTNISFKDAVSAIKTKTDTAISQKETISKLMFMIMYLNTSNGYELSTYNNNYTNTLLDMDWGQSSDYFVKDNFVCLQGNKTKKNSAFAMFESLNQNIEFLYSRVWQRAAILTGTTNSDLTRFYILSYPVKQDDNVYNTMQQSDIQEIENKVSQSMTLFSQLYP